MTKCFESMCILFVSVTMFPATAIEVQFSIEKDFSSSGVVCQHAVDREMKRITGHAKVNQSYIRDCVNDARMRRQHHGSVVQSYDLSQKLITDGGAINKQVVLNVAVISNKD